MSLITKPWKTNSSDNLANNSYEAACYLPLHEHKPLERYTPQHAFCEYNVMCRLTNIAHICNDNLATCIPAFGGTLSYYFILLDYGVMHCVRLLWQLFK